MGMLDNVVSGKIKKPLFVLMHGVDGVGKTSWAADAPKVIFLGNEEGSNFLDVARFPQPKTFNDIMKAIAELSTSKHEYKTLCLDSLDWIESLVWAHVCQENGWKNIEEPGWGKGYIIALESWKKKMSALFELREKRGMAIIALCHTVVKSFNDPNLPAPYERYQLKLQDRASAFWREAADCVLFANFEVYIKEGKGGQKTKAFSEGKRIMFTERRAGFDAKNRLGLPFELPLSYAAFEEASDKGEPDSLPTIKASIKSLMANITDKELLKKVNDTIIAAGDDVTKNEKILNRLRVVVGNV